METVNFIIGISNASAAILVAALSIPLILEKVKMNNYYGARFTKSFESNENWYVINKKAGKLSLLWSIVVFALGGACFFLPKLEGPTVWILGGAALLYSIPAVQTYLFSRKL